MDFNDIMNKITSGLTGDNKENISYLQKVIEEYKDHELSKEIIRACGRMIYELIPDDNKQELSKIVGNSMKSIDATIDEISYNIYKKEYDQALKLSEALVNSVENYGMYSDDTESEYHTFNEPIEDLLFRYYTDTDRCIRRANIPYSKIYFQYGNLLFELQRYEEAKSALEKALKWNPADVNILFEYSELFKMSGDIENYYKINKDIFKYVHTPSALARCYRNLGYYFVEKKNYEAATGCLYLSLQYDAENKTAISELFYIRSVVGGEIKTPSEEEMRKLAEKYDFPLGAHNDVIGVAYAYGKSFAEEGENDAAIYCFNIVYALTENEDIAKLIKMLETE